MQTNERSITKTYQKTSKHTHAPQNTSHKLNTSQLNIETLTMQSLATSSNLDSGALVWPCWILSRTQRNWNRTYILFAIKFQNCVHIGALYHLSFYTHTSGKSTSDKIRLVTIIICLILTYIIFLAPYYANFMASLYLLFWIISIRLSQSQCPATKLPSC